MITESVQSLSNLNDKLSEGLSNKLSEGLYREVYRHGEFAVKKTKHHVTKKLLFVEFNIPTSLYTLIKFAISDLNEYEYRKYQAIITKIPAHLQECFAKVHKPVKEQGICYSINQLVVDDDGQVSKSLQQYGKISEPEFWNTIDQLEAIFLEEQIYYMSIGGYNVSVKQKADGSLVPVFVDYKRIGRRTFWHQIPLYFPYFLKLKMRRRFQRLREEFKGC